MHQPGLCQWADCVCVSNVVSTQLGIPGAFMLVYYKS